MKCGENIAKYSIQLVAHPGGAGSFKRIYKRNAFKQ
jgi:hypothetical protein